MGAVYLVNRLHLSLCPAMLHHTVAGAQITDITIGEAKTQLIQKINEYFEENLE